MYTKLQEKGNINLDTQASSAIRLVVFRPQLPGANERIPQRRSSLFLTSKYFGGGSAHDRDVGRAQMLGLC